MLGPATYPWQARLRLLPPPAPSVAAVGTQEGHEAVATPEEDVRALALLIRQVIKHDQIGCTCCRVYLIMSLTTPPSAHPSPMPQLLTAAGLPAASVGASCDALLSHMTHPDPTARPSMEEVLAHPWLASSMPAADYYGACTL